MKINIGKFVSQLISGKKPVDILINDVNAELDRVEKKVLIRAQAGEDLSHIIDDAFGDVKSLIAVYAAKIHT